MYSLWIVQWDFTRRDHPGNPGRVSGSGPVIVPVRTTHNNETCVHKMSTRKIHQQVDLVTCTHLEKILNGLHQTEG